LAEDVDAEFGEYLVLEEESGLFESRLENFSFGWKTTSTNEAVQERTLEDGSPNAFANRSVETKSQRRFRKLITM